MTEEDRTYAKIARRLIPFLLLCFTLAYLDRINIGFAKLRMESDLHFGDATYGLGAGVFFLGYCLFEIPSNAILARVGARVWIARIMLTWGAIAVATAFVRSAPGLYLARFALGVAEAGFFPGIIYYLALWFPRRRQAGVIALFMTGVAIAGLAGGPLSGAIMQRMDGVHALTGWQWLFILEGALSILAGAAALFLLEDDVRQATWLHAREKSIVRNDLAAEDVGTRATSATLSILYEPRAWYFGAVYFCFSMGLYGTGFWLPQLIKNAGVAELSRIGLYSAMPYGVAAATMIWIGRRSDAAGERRGHIAACAAVSCLGLIVGALKGDAFWFALPALTAATAGILSVYPPLWALCGASFRGPARAAGIAMVNSLGGLAGFVGPSLIGAVTEKTHSPAGGLLAVAGCVVLGGLLTARAPR